MGARYIIRQASAERAAVPSAVAKAAFKIENVGDLGAEVIKTSQGFHVIQKTAYRRPYRRNLSDVQDKIRLKLFRKRKGDAMRDYVINLRKNAQVEIDEDVLKKAKAKLPTQPIPNLSPPIPTSRKAP